MEDNKIKVKYVDPIQNITTNPFFASRLLHSFFTGYDKENASLNLIYLVLPLVFYRSSEIYWLQLKVRAPYEAFSWTIRLKRLL